MNGQKTNNKKKTVILIAVIAAVILLIVLLIVLLSQCESDKPNDPTSTPAVISSTTANNTGTPATAENTTGTSTPTGTSATTKPTETPVTATPTETPVTATPTETPVTPTKTTITPTPTETPVTVTPVHKHSFGDWVVLTEPACLSPGARQRVCTECGEKQEEELPPLGHKGVNNVCVRCGKTATNEGLSFKEDDENPGGIVLRSLAALTEEDVLLPDLYDSKPITRIVGNSSENDTVRFISVPDSVKSVDDWAFAYFSALEGVHFGKDMSSISRAVIFYSGNVRWLTVDAENMYYHDYCNCVIRTDEKKLVLGCSGSVIPDDGSVEIIANSSLAHATFTRLVIPDGVKTIEDYSINDCWELVDLYISDSVTEIGTNAFMSCHSLKNVRLSASLTVIDNEVFFDCTALESIVIPDKVKEIKYETFEDCTSLKNVTLPEGLVSIYNPFKGCTALESITLPSTLTYLGDAFAGCTALKKLVVPDNVESLGMSFISRCSALEELILPAKIDRIYRNNFYKVSSLKSVTIPEGVTTIEGESFVECAKLESIVLPKSLHIVSSDAIVDCPALKTIYYAGSEEDWAKIKIYGDNDALRNATIVYNYSV